MRAVWILTLLIAGWQAKQIANFDATDSQNAKTASGITDASAIPHQQKTLKLGPTASRKTQAETAKPVEQFLNMPLDFESNEGQAPSEYAFVAHGPSYTLGISATGMALRLLRPESNAPSAQDSAIFRSFDASILELRLVGANGESQVTGLEAQPGRSNYFIGNDPSKWRTGIPHFGRVRVAATYPGIDVVFHGDHQQLEYDFDVAPGADPNRIRLQAQGAQSVTIDANGNALLHTPAGDVELKRPVAYQQIAGVQRPVESSFRVEDGDFLEFEVGSYDREYALTIDPVLDYAVSLGGANLNYGMGIAVDASGNAYVSGATCSGDFPTTPGKFQQFPSPPSMTAFNRCDASFVTKIDPTGSTLLYSDLIGGTDASSGAGHLAIDSSGNVYLSGVTNSTDFPTISNFGPSSATSCPLATQGRLCLVGFVLKLDPTGSTLIFSSLFGGNGGTVAAQIKLNPVTGDVEVLGDTDSTNFLPAATTLQTSYAGGTCASGIPCVNAFLLGLSPTTGALRYGTFIGGQGNDFASSLAFDSNGNIYVAGTTQPPLSTALGPVTQTYAPAGGATAAGVEMFVAKLNLSGTSLTPGYLTIIQGDADTGPAEIVFDSSNNLYFTGASAAQHLPVTTGAYQTVNKATGANDCLWRGQMTLLLPHPCGTAIVGGLNSAGALSFLTYMGGSTQDIGEAIGIDSNKNLWIAGVTTSTDFPFAAAHYTFQSGLFNSFLAEMSNNGQQLLDATPIAGSNGEVGDLQIDGNNNVYVVGYANEVPSTPGAYPPNPGVFIPAFVQKWSAGPPPSISILLNSLGFPSTPLGSASQPQTITVQNTGTVAAQLGIQLGPGYTETSPSDFLESSNCGTSLAANSSCTITITFAPGPVPATCQPPVCVPTQRGAELLIANNAIQGTKQIELGGTAGIGPSAIVSPNPIVFAAQAAGTSSAPLYVSAEDGGDSALLISNIALTGPNASDFQLTLTGVGGNNCNVPLQPGSLCDLDVTFSPPASATGTRTATLMFTDDAADSPQSVNITGTVAASYALNLSPLTVSPTFPVAIGTSSYGVLSVENPSTTNTVQVTSLSISGTNAGDFSVTSVSCSTAGSLPMTIAPGATCYADVTFNPAAGASGLRTASMTVGTNPVISGLPTLALQGDAVTNSQPGMSFFVIPNPMNFGGLQVGETSNNASVLFTIYNNIPIPCAGGGSTCGAPLIINSITPGLADYTVNAEAQSGVCSPFPVTIPAGGECTYAVVFSPSQSGTRNTTLTIQSNDPQGTMQLPVYGSGLSVPLGEFLETALNFGNSAIAVASPPMTTTLQNAGQTALNITGVTASANFAVSANSCTGSLAPKATCSVSVTFTPPTAGFFSGMLTISDNDPLGGQQVVNLTGTGATGPQLRITPQTLNFSNQVLNTASPAQTITFTSTGDSTVTFPSQPINTTPDFLLENTTCAGSLAVGASCTANVQFKPTVAALVGGYEDGSMFVSDNVVGSPQPIYLQGTSVQGTTASSTTALVSSLNPSTSGQSVTFTATVTGPSGNMTVPTGSVNFMDGTTTLGSGTLNGSGTTTYTTAALSAGSHLITAVYSGDSNFSGSTSNVVTQVVNAASKASTTALVSSLNPSTSGQSVTFTATVTGPSGNTTAPTGSVSFMDGTTSLGSGALNGSGIATYTTATLSVGSHSITAVYGGDTNFTGSTSNVVSQVVNAAKAASTTTVTSSASPSTAGQSVTFTATVAGPSGSTTVPTGAVNFLDGTTTLATATLNPAGVAIYSTGSLTTGAHSITAVYAGDSNFNGSTSNILAQVVNPAAKFTSTTTVTSSPNPSGQGQSVTFTANVAGPTGNTTVPTGTITFMDGTTSLGTGSLNASAQATYSTSSLSIGSHSITAVYGGDTNFAGSTSTAMMQTVNPPSFTVSFTPSTVTINPGQTGTTTITVMPQYGFNQQVSFACSGLPAASTCSFSPSTVTPNGSAATSTLSIATNVAMTPLDAPSPFGPRRSMEKEALLAFVLLGLGGIFRARRRWRSFFCGLVVFAGMGLIISGCGGKSSSSSGGGNPTTPAGTSTITVTVSAGSLNQSATFTLVVQ
jgi:hypothetical protein